jgi:hypothetical protein
MTGMKMIGYTLHNYERKINNVTESFFGSLSGHEKRRKESVHGCWAMQAVENQQK